MWKITRQKKKKTHMTDFILRDDRFIYVFDKNIYMLWRTFQLSYSIEK